MGKLCKIVDKSGNYIKGDYYDFIRNRNPNVFLYCVYCGECTVISVKKWTKDGLLSCTFSEICTEINLISIGNPAKFEVIPSPVNSRIAELIKNNMDDNRLADLLQNDLICQTEIYARCIKSANKWKYVEDGTDFSEEPRYGHELERDKTLYQILKFDGKSVVLSMIKCHDGVWYEFQVSNSFFEIYYMDDKGCYKYNHSMSSPVNICQFLTTKSRFDELLLSGMSDTEIANELQDELVAGINEFFGKY